MDTHRDRFAVVTSDDRCGTEKKRRIKGDGKGRLNIYYYRVIFSRKLNGRVGTIDSNRR
jgi:mRNA-degrading endonuclease RelE of RelBE toxin-antitoxin system